MVFFTGGGSIRLPNVPQPVSSSSSSLARIASRHRQQTAPAPSRAGHGPVSQRRGDQPGLAALASSIGAESRSWNASDIATDTVSGFACIARGHFDSGASADLGCSLVMILT